MSTVIASYHDEAAWLERRRQGIGGSEVAALFGLHPFKSARDVWAEKTGLVTPHPDSPDLRRGRRLEDVAAQLYSEETGRKLRRQPLRAHREQPLVLASIDRQIIAGDGYGTGACELKVPRVRNWYRWKREGIPEYIIMQGQHEALAWEYPYTGFGIYNPDDDALLHFDVEADDQVSARILEYVPEWWERHVIRGIEPDDNAPVPDVKLPEVAGEVVRIDSEEFAERAREYFEARELEKEAAELKKAAQAELKKLIGAYGVFECQGMRFYHSQRPGNAKHAETLKAVRARKPVDGLELVNVLADFGIQLEDAAAIVARAQLNIDELEVRGKPFDDFRGFVVRSYDE